MSAQSQAFEFQFSIPCAHPALPGHFPGHPIVPGVLLLDRVLSGVTAALHRPVAVLQKVKFVAPLLPDEPATVSCQATGDRLVFSVQAWRDGILMTLAEGDIHLAHRSTPSPPPSATPAGRSFRE